MGWQKFQFAINFSFQKDWLRLFMMNIDEFIYEKVLKNITKTSEKIYFKNGGGGIRTHVTFADTLVFKA